MQQVRLVDENGGQLGVKPINEALEYAHGKDLDLVEVAAQAAAALGRPSIPSSAAAPAGMISPAWGNESVAATGEGSKLGSGSARPDGSLLRRGNPPSSFLPPAAASRSLPALAGGRGNRSGGEDLRRYG